MSTDPKAAALDWVRRALEETLPREAPADLLDLAYQLCSVASDHDVPIEELVLWIHSAEMHSVEAWRRHALAYVELRRRLCEPSTGQSRQAP